MSSEQWAAIMRGDESYAGARSLRRGKQQSRIFWIQVFVPTHQGRAENILFVFGEAWDVCAKQHAFRHHRCQYPRARRTPDQPGDRKAFDINNPVHSKATWILQNCEPSFKRSGRKIPFGMMTVTNNAGGGQPVSLMENLKAVAAVYRESKIPFFIVPPAMPRTPSFIQITWKGYENKPVIDIAR
ncbi:beta-eliminating lyase-related protein [Candidatus Villigracilis saccharophilus]|uniref:beta-eliminating lyase-related protein n=1 Tax=Candidatus Villigracilis saccharophilus TaxID=3140684 RepID=UPI0031EB5C8E